MGYSQQQWVDNNASYPLSAARMTTLENGVASSYGAPVGGLTGATAATRYAGATASGAPGSGTFNTGDYVIDQTGVIWICTTGGSPGTWSKVGGSASTKTTRTVSGVTDTIQSSDFTNVVEYTNSSLVTVTIPTFAGAVTTDADLELMPYGAGGIVVMPGGAANRVQNGDSSSNGGSSSLRSNGATVRPFGSNVTVGNTVIAAIRQQNGGVTGTKTVASITGGGGSAANWQYMGGYWTAGGHGLEVWQLPSAPGTTPSVAVYMASTTQGWLGYFEEWNGNKLVASFIPGAGANNANPLIQASAPGPGTAAVAFINTGLTSGVTDPSSPWQKYDQGAWAISNYGLAAATIWGENQTGATFGATWTQAATDWAGMGVLLTTTPSVTVLSPGNLDHSAAQYGGLTVRYRGSDQHFLDGRLQ